MWKYYNFDEHWKEFLEVWKSENVQSKLDSEMHSWMKDYPTTVYKKREKLVDRSYVTTPGGGKYLPQYSKYNPDTDKKSRLYNRGDSLWKFSNDDGDYWMDKIHNNEEDFDADLNSFVKSIANVHPCLVVRGKEMIPSRQKLIEFFMDNEAYEEHIIRQHEKNAPKKETIDSMIMIGGKSYLTKPLYIAATMLFYGHQVFVVEDIDGNDQILIPGQKIVFDLYNFYFITRDKDTNPSVVLQSDEYYDSKFGVIDEYNEMYYSSDDYWSDDSDFERHREWEREFMELNGEWTDNSDWTDHDSD